MKVLLATIVCLVMATSARAMLRRGPEVQSVAIGLGNSNVVCIRIDAEPVVSALSTNAGLTFLVIDESQIPKNLTTNLDAGGRHYVLVDGMSLLRSDDGGATWTNTAASSFLRTQGQMASQQEAKWFRITYGSRIPDRSVFWHPLFALFAAGYIFTVLWLPRGRGKFAAFLTAMRGMVVILVIWSFLLGFHAVIRNWTDSQYPHAYWNTSARICPGPKVGLAMAIAARPLPLLAYLVALWPIMPGSLDALLTFCRSAPIRKRVCFGVAIEAGALVFFHLWMMFFGYLFE